MIEEALNAVNFLGWLKKFGPAQNILGPVKGQGISNISMQMSSGCYTQRDYDITSSVFPMKKQSAYILFICCYFLRQNNLIGRKIRKTKFDFRCRTR